MLYILSTRNHSFTYFERVKGGQRGRGNKEGQFGGVARAAGVLLSDFFSHKNIIVILFFGGYYSTILSVFTKKQMKIKNRSKKFTLQFF